MIPDTPWSIIISATSSYDPRQPLVDHNWLRTGRANLMITMACRPISRGIPTHKLSESWGTKLIARVNITVKRIHISIGNSINDSNVKLSCKVISMYSAVLTHSPTHSLTGPKARPLRTQGAMGPREQIWTQGRADPRAHGS